MKLYKYRGKNYLIENLNKKHLYFGPIKNVNDPYEGSHKFIVNNDIRPFFYEYFYREKYNEIEFSKYSKEENILLEDAVVNMHFETINNEYGIISFIGKALLSM